MLILKKICGHYTIVRQEPGGKFPGGVLLARQEALDIKKMWPLEPFQSSDSLASVLYNSLAWLYFTTAWWHICTCSLGACICQSKSVCQNDYPTTHNFWYMDVQLSIIPLWY